MAAVIASRSEKYKKALEEDKRMVKGRFSCHQPEGGSVKFSYRKYKEIPKVDYSLVDGEEYELPVMVVKHLNNCGWDVHSHILDKDGNPTIATGKRIRRFTFQSLDFIV